MNVLLIENNTDIADSILASLSKHGCHVECAADGPTGLDMVCAETQDILIVDRLLPHMDGLELVREIRARGIQTPILFLSALDEVDDCVKGLRAGADDYLVRPFAMPELLARMEALVRRSTRHGKFVELQVGDLHMNLLTRTVTRSGVKIDLPPQEFRLLEYFMRNAGQIVTRTMLLNHVWGFRFDPRTSVVETHISRLRIKIDREFQRKLLQTFRGVGYRLHEPRPLKSTAVDGEPTPYPG